MCVKIEVHLFPKALSSIQNEDTNTSFASIGYTTGPNQLEALDHELAATKDHRVPNIKYYDKSKMFLAKTHNWLSSCSSNKQCHLKTRKSLGWVVK
jgi:hypothetical protein